MHPVGFGQTDVGRTREQNEDCMFADDGLGLYVVCDGMGGHAAGEVASASAIETVAEELKSQIDTLTRCRRGQGPSEAVIGVVRDAVQKACVKVWQLAAADEARTGMGCTLTLLLVLGNKAFIAHVGDSRLYLLRAEKLSQLTTDHTMANELAQAGLISAEEVKDHQYAHVLTRAIGTQPHVTADVLMMDVVPGDRFLLCSDGLADHIDDEDWIGERLAEETAIVPQSLIDFANSNGGHDNVTVIAVAVEPDDPEIEIIDEMSSEVQGKFEALQAVFMFEGLSLALLTRVLQSCDIDSYNPGDVVVSKGESCGELRIVLEGKLSLLEGKGDGERELGPGQHVGATTLLAPRAARATLAAKSACRLLTLRREPFWSLIKSRPWLGVGLLERLNRRLAEDIDDTSEGDGL